MEKGRLTDCIDMRYHTKGLIKDNSNIILRALGEQDTVSLHISTEDSGGRGRQEEDAVNEDVRAQKDALENMNTQENIKKDSNKYFAEKV